MWFIRWFWLLTKKINIFIWREVCKRTHCPSIVNLDPLLFIWKCIESKKLEKIYKWSAIENSNLYVLSRILLQIFIIFFYRVFSAVFKTLPVIVSSKSKSHISLSHICFKVCFTLQHCSVYITLFNLFSSLYLYLHILIVQNFISQMFFLNLSYVCLVHISWVTKACML